MALASFLGERTVACMASAACAVARNVVVGSCWPWLLEILVVAVAVHGAKL